MSELHWATLWEAIADEVPEAPAVVQGDVRRSWGELEDRAARFAGLLGEAGIGPDAKVAQFLFNGPAYVETWFGTLKARGVPVNVNYRYLDEELRYLLDNADAEALVYHSSLGDRVARVLDGLPGLKLVVEVDDGEGAGRVASAVPYEAALAGAVAAERIERSPSDHVMTYTGGTTGMPKGVVGRIGGGVAGLLAAVPTLLGRAPVADVGGAVALTRTLHDDGASVVALPACPLMHATGLVIGMQTALLFGGTVALLPSRRFDAGELWDVVERERVSLVAVVGDPFARPMLRALDEAAADRDLDALRFISSSGAMFSTEVKEGLLRHLPGATILDYISSTEGLMGVSISSAGKVAPTGSFHPAAGVKVLRDDGAEVTPGSGEAGIVGLANGVPDGYYKDEAKSAATFREVGGVRYSFPGDWATVEENGSLSLLGRGSQCINTGGEKVFPEEVEEVVKRHPAVDDCLVFGLPDERFGQRIVALASLGEGEDIVSDDVLAVVRDTLAGYKVPRSLLVVDHVPRTASGKADYGAAREIFASAQP